MRLLATASLVVVLGSACFDVAPPVEPTEKPKGTISGRILVSGISGQRVVAVDAAAAARDAVAAAWPDRLIVDGTVDTIDVQAPAKAPAPEFVPGDALILFDRGAFDVVTMTKALEGMRKKAGLDDVTITMSRCVARFFCVVKMTDEKGFLDEEGTVRAVNALHKARLPQMRHVGTNELAYGSRVPNDPFLSRQWHLGQIKMPAAWDLEIGDPDLVVAVIDSGVVHANPDLRGRLARDPNNANIFVEADFVDGAHSNDGDGPDLSAEDPGDNLLGEGRHSFHGTHVAGIIGAQTNNRVGVAGVMWQAKILPVRVLGAGLAGSLADIITGLLWAVGEPDTGTGLPGNLLPAKVVNMSLGGATSPTAQALWQDAIDLIFTDPEGKYNDPILICAAGNQSVNAESIVPANIPRLLTVGASRADGLRANYSNFGGPIDVMAPGGQSNLDLNNDGEGDGILSTIGVDIGFEQGTSMSAPQVAGLAGLLVSSKPNLTHDEVHELITQTADVRFRCNEGCGSGLINAVQALIAAGVEVDPAPNLQLDTSRVVFAGGVTSATIKLLNLGNADAPFTLALERSQANLFTVTPTSGIALPASPSNTGIDITLTLARGAVDVGTAVLVVTGTGAAAGQKVNATLSFDTNPSRGRRSVATVDVGVFSKASGTLKRVGSAVALAETGFAWSVGGLTAGSYEVYAVGDDNRDGTFDRQRESFGAYPIPDGIQQVVIEDEAVAVTGIDFPITLQVAELSTRGVGAPCTDDNTAATQCADILTFAPSVGCITSFDGGYCSRFCEDDNICGPTGRCEVLSCPGGECAACLQGCVADAQCRPGYLCVFDTCVPEGFYDTTP